LARLGGGKLPEVEALIARAHEMKRLIEESVRCGCLSLEECALSLRPPPFDGSPEATGVGDTTGVASHRRGLGQ
jgi:hypothetical protein